MAARQSAATDRALRLVARGMTPYAAAKKTGIAFSTIYLALKRQRSRETSSSNGPPPLAGQDHPRNGPARDCNARTERHESRLTCGNDPPPISFPEQEGTDK